MRKKPPPPFKEPGVVSGEWLFWMHATIGVPPMFIEDEHPDWTLDMDRYRALMAEHAEVSRTHA